LAARADEAAPAGDDAHAALHAVIERDPLSIDGHQLDAPRLRRFYSETGYDLIWVGKDQRIAALSAAIAASADDGVNVPDGLPDPFSAKVESDAERDVLISDAALRFAASMATGRARPERWEEDWAVPAPAFDAVTGLERALHFGKLAPWLASLAPS